MAKEKTEKQYRDAPEVEEIAQELIEEHHLMLGEAMIFYVFNSEPEKIRGQTALGTARKLSGLNAWMALRMGESPALATPQEFFLISIWTDAWAALDVSQRRALVDHELCHCKLIEDEETADFKLKIVGHDIEEFHQIVQRHGLWLEHHEEFLKAIEDYRNGQARLPEVAA